MRAEARRGGRGRPGFAWALAVGLALVALAAALSEGGLTAGGSPQALATVSRPNVVVVTTDDQTAESLRAMPNVRTLIGEQGATFPESFVNFSLCCPSRSTFLTGQYAHNHGVLGNTPPSGGFDQLDSTNTLAVWMQGAGYYTGLIGKYLNGYEQHRNDTPPLVPPGWTEWRGSTITYTYYGYELNEDGTLVAYGSNPEDYSTDTYTAKAVDFIQRLAPSAQPFFLWLTYLAPHNGGPDPNPNPPANCGGSAKPAPRHAHVFDTEPLPQPPSFNEADVSDKPPAIRNLPSLTDADIADITRRYRCRLESLPAEDEGVAQIVGALEASGELDDTLIVFTSDNGFMHGEHRVTSGKVKLYEESIRVPLLIRGPGIPPGETVREMAINPDLAPTILNAANVVPGRIVDGRSLLPIVAKPSAERGRELLIETASYAAIRTHRYIYAEHSNGASELYDLARDPYELQSLHDDPAFADVKAALAQRLAKLRNCAGRGCRRAPDLDMDLSRRHDRQNGHRCLLRPARAAVGGSDQGQLDVARFYVNGVLVATDRSAPFRRMLPYWRLKLRHVARVRILAGLVDGREMTLDRRVRACR